MTSLAHKNTSLHDTELDEFARRLLAEAYAWIGTPFGHQGRIKQRQVDCANFIEVCFRSAGADTNPIPNNYRPEEDGSLMMTLLSEKLVYIEKGDHQPSDVIAFCDEALVARQTPRHLAFISEVTPTTTFIIEAGREKVVRHRLNGWWWQRVHSIWRYPR